MPEQKSERYEDSLLYRIRHSTAHIMAQAVLEKFPTAKIAIGPAIEDGYYYDFDLPRPLTPEEVEEVTYMARRLAAIVLMEPALNANYQAVKGASYAWPNPMAFVEDKGLGASRIDE